MDEDKSKKRKKIAAWVICPLVLIGLGAGIVSCQQQGTHKDQTVQVQKKAKSKSKTKAAAGRSTKQADKTVEEAMTDAGLISSDTNGNYVSVSDDGLVGENDLAAALSGGTTTSALALVDDADAQVKTLAAVETPAVVTPLDNAGTSTPSTDTGSGSTGTGTDTGTDTGNEGSGDGGTDVTPTNAKPVVVAPAAVTVDQHGSYDKMAGVSATDAEDGDITSHIRAVGYVNLDQAGTYKMVYFVADSQGTPAVATTIVTVKQVDPVITAKQPTDLKVGDTFDALKDVTAVDKDGNDLTSKITADGSVDTSKPGSYDITYSVTDAAGVSITKKVTFKVTAPAPTITTTQATDLKLGDTFDAMQGVTANDYQGTDLTSAVTTEGSVDTSKPGQYSVIYTVKDALGTETSTTIVFTVADPEAVNPVTPGDPVTPAAQTEGEE